MGYKGFDEPNPKKDDDIRTIYKGKDGRNYLTPEALEEANKEWDKRHGTDEHMQEGEDR